MDCVKDCVGQREISVNETNCLIIIGQHGECLLRMESVRSTCKSM